MGFGLSISLLSFSSFSGFKQQKVSIYRDIQTLELLAALVVVCLRKKFKFELKNTPTMYNIGWYLGEIFSKYTPSQTHPILKCFFTHFLLTADDYDLSLIPLMVRIKNELYITPRGFSYAPEILSSFTEEDLPVFFDKLKIESFMPFWWQLQDSWVPELKVHVTKHDNNDVLTLAQVSDEGEFLVRSSLFGFYTLLFDAFKTFPFTSDETRSKDLIYNYIITMKDFFEMKSE